MYKKGKYTYILAKLSGAFFNQRKAPELPSLEVNREDNFFKNVITNHESRAFLIVLYRIIISTS